MILSSAKSNYIFTHMGKGAYARGGQQGDTFNPGGSGKGLATWDSLLLAWGLTEWDLCPCKQLSPK
jgi:hypothetical protein